VLVKNGSSCISLIKTAQMMSWKVYLVWNNSLRAPWTTGYPQIPGSRTLLSGALQRVRVARKSGHTQVPLYLLLLRDMAPQELSLSFPQPLHRPASAEHVVSTRPPDWSLAQFRRQQIPLAPGALLLSGL
jgi:hypothetical protein